MIYTIRVVVTANTKTNKLELVTEDKRIVVTPVTRTGKDAFLVVDDRPVGTPQYVADFLRFLVQNLYGRKEVNRIAKEMTDNAKPNS